MLYFMQTVIIRPQVSIHITGQIWYQMMLVNITRHKKLKTEENYIERGETYI